MKTLVLSMALVCLGSHAFAEAKSCTLLFQDNKSMEIIRGDKEDFYTVTELEMSREEFEAIRRVAQERREAKPESRIATYQNKSAMTDGNAVAIESLVAGNKKIYQKEFEIQNTNGYFEQGTGQYWVMPHNEGRLVVWNYTKNRVYDVKLPQSTVLVDVAFDLTSNIYQPKMLIEYRKHVDHSEMVESSQMEIDLLTGKEI